MADTDTQLIKHDDTYDYALTELAYCNTTTDRTILHEKHKQTKKTTTKKQQQQQKPGLNTLHGGT